MSETYICEVILVYFKRLCCSDQVSHCVYLTLARFCCSADQDDWQIGALRRAEPADGQNIGVDPDMARRGIGAHRRNRRAQSAASRARRRSKDSR